MSDFHVRLERSDGNASGQLVLAGDLSIRNAQALYQQILDAREKAPVLQVMFEEVTSVDLALFQILFALQREKANSVQFFVSEHDTVMRKWLKMSGLTSLIQPV